MSLFLSKVHYILYDKIHLQEQLTDFILADTAVDTTNKIYLSLYSGYGSDFPPLETVIDTANIHGWLQKRIDKAESRFAVLITELVRDNPPIFPSLEKAALRFGMQNAAPCGINAENAFEYISGLLLDGMPCSRVYEIKELNGNRAVWQRTFCAHLKYWQEIGGDIGLYYKLRSEVIRGILNNTELTFTEKDGLCILS